MQENAFVQASDAACSSEWAAWPEIHERAIAKGTYMVWNLSSSVGHLMRTLMYILPVRGYRMWGRVARWGEGATCTL